MSDVQALNAKALKKMTSKFKENGELPPNMGSAYARFQTLQKQ